MDLSFYEYLERHGIQLYRLYAALAAVDGELYEAPPLTGRERFGRCCMYHCREFCQRL